MSENTIEVLAVSLADAREQLQAPIPVGRLVLSEPAAKECCAGIADDP